MRVSLFSIIATICATAATGDAVFFCRKQSQKRLTNRITHAMIFPSTPSASPDPRPGGFSVDFPVRTQGQMSGIWPAWSRYPKAASRAIDPELLRVTKQCGAAHKGSRGGFRVLNLVSSLCCLIRKGALLVW